MDPTEFLADIERTPSSLSALARAVDADAAMWPLDHPPRRILLTGMGSSHYAAAVAAARLRSHGLDAVAEIASSELTWPASPELLVVAISASGTSVETIDLVERYLGTSRVIALTNTDRSPLGDLADATVDMAAGPEPGGVACRSFRHTLAALFVLESQLIGSPAPTTVIRRAATATGYLLDRREAWFPETLDLLATDDGTWFLAPAERSSSSLQGALMIREGPRRRADGCETGDWNHVDVYLTKTLDYRAVVFTGSRYDASAARWMRQRHTTSVAVGGELPGAGLMIRYPGDDHTDVALLTEVVVAELLAAQWWASTT